MAGVERLCLCLGGCKLHAVLVHKGDRALPCPLFALSFNGLFLECP